MVFFDVKSDDFFKSVSKKKLLSRKCICLVGGLALVFYICWHFVVRKSSEVSKYHSTSTRRKSSIFSSWWCDGCTIVIDILMMYFDEKGLVVTRLFEYRLGTRFEASFVFILIRSTIISWWPNICWRFDKSLHAKIEEEKYLQNYSLFLLLPSNLLSLFDSFLFDEEMYRGLINKSYCLYSIPIIFSLFCWLLAMLCCVST